jgi:hypothetical protein
MKEETTPYMVAEELDKKMKAEKRRVKKKLKKAGKIF